MLFPIEYIVYLNIAILLVLVLFAYSGYKQGFLCKVVGCLGFLICGILAWPLSSLLAKLLHLLPADLAPMKDTVAGPIFYDSINRILVFLLIFIVFSIIILILKPLAKVVSSLPIIAQINALLGIVFGMLQGLVIVMIASFVFSTPLFANGSRVIEGSFLKPIGAATETMLFFAQDHLEQLKAVQKIVTPSTILSEEDLAHIKDWLLSNNLEESQINAFLTEIAGE